MINEKKYFNTLMGVDDIANAYHNNNFPDSYCLLTPSLEYNENVVINTDVKDNIVL